MISSQVARAESAVAEGREKVAVGGVEVGCSASLDGEVVVEALLRQFTLRWNIFHIFCFESTVYSVVDTRVQC